MKSNNIVKPVGDGDENAFAIFCRSVWDRVFGGDFPIKGKGSTTVSYSDGYYVVSSEPQRVLPVVPADLFPFNIYKIDNASATDEQKAAYTAIGVDINSYTYQVRSGYIGYRSKNFAFAGATFEFPVFCHCTDGTVLFYEPPSANNGSTVILQNLADVLIYDPTTATPTVFPQIALDPALDGLQSCKASFYIKLIDDPVNGLYAQLWGRMYTEDPEIFRQFGILPSYVDSSIILIGSVENSGALSQAGTHQYLSSNLVNRYAALAPLGTNFGPINIQRGYWDQDSLSGQVFYRGDIVVDDTVALFTPSDYPAYSFYGVYTYTGLFAGTPEPADFIAIITDSPGIEINGWTMTGTVLILTI